MTNPNFGERTLLDFKQWSKLGGLYYQRNPQNEKEIRTIMVRYNTVAGKYVMHAPSNWHTAEPTPEMRPYHDGIGRAITTMQPAESRGFY
mgnify:CR=1 FL=1